MHFIFLAGSAISYLKGQDQIAFLFIYYSDVGFMAYPSDAITTIAYAKIKFNRVDRNDGQGYDVNNGTFTAPVDGMYNFYWSLLFYSGGSATIRFNLNGTPKIRSQRNVMDGRSSSTSGSIYLRLKVGDQVYLEADSSWGQRGRATNSLKWPNKYQEYESDFRNLNLIACWSIRCRYYEMCIGRSSRIRIYV